MILYHGTNFNLIETILEDGLKGGDNSFGGTHGTWDIPRLFITPNIWVAEKYGTDYIVINIPEIEIEKFGFEITNDGLGDKCWILEGSGILIPPEYLSSPAYDYKNGICSESEYCKHHCVDYNTCPYFKEGN